MVSLTAQEHREAAAAATRAAQESFERSDTDGFLSQWASGLTAQKHRAEAALIEAGGVIEALVLFDVDGNIASTHQGFSQYGEYWVLNDAAAEKYGKRFFSPSKAFRPGVAYRNDRAKGFVFGYVEVAGYVEIVSSGTGLSSFASARVVTAPSVEALKAHDFKVVATDVDRLAE